MAGARTRPEPSKSIGSDVICRLSRSNSGIPNLPHPGFLANYSGQRRQRVSDPAQRFAPGWPGIAPRWTSSAKTGVGTSLSLSSRVWFTISHGILNEIYYPRVDQACTRDMGLIVTDGQSYFSEEKRH